MDTLEIIDKAIERIRWAAGIVELTSTDPDCGQRVSEDADCAAAQLANAGALLLKLADRDDLRTLATSPKPD